ncbi:MAG: J domain-containing protein [Planctomycetota bacterium]
MPPAGARLRDYYQLLGVTRQATPDEIRDAYRGLARKLHPDVNKADDAQERFSELQTAYEVLGEPEKRRIYDRVGHSAYTRGGGARATPTGAADGFGFEAEDLSSVFDAFFGGGRARGPGPKARQRQEPTRIELPITFMTAINGGRERVRVTRSGDPRPVEVTVPPGVTDGSKLRARIPGDGSEAVFVVKVGGHPVFRRVADNAADLEFDLPLTVAEAALGARIAVPTPDGPVGVSVPAGSAGGQRLRLRGHGVKGRDDAPAGDLFARIRIVPPQPGSLTDEDRRALEDLGRKTPPLRSGDGWPEQDTESPA